MKGLEGKRTRYSNRRSRWLWSGVAIVLVALLYLAGSLAPLERQLADLRFELTGRDASGDLVVIGIDPDSLRQLDSWPWPRRYHAAVIEKLVEAGAEQIALDIDLSSRSAPEDDAALRDALSRAGGRVILPVFRQKAASGSGESELFHTVPLEDYRQLTRLASVNTIPEGDGLIRRYAMSNYWKDGYMPTMSAILAGQTQPLFEIFHIDYGIRPETLPYISYVDLLNDRFDPGLVQGRKVIIGATAAELGDQFAVPVHKAMAGPVVQALAYESIVQNRTLYRSAPWLVIAGLLAIGFGLGRRLQVGNWRRGLSVVLGLSAAVLVISLLMQFWTPIILEVTPWVLTTVLLYGIALARKIDRQEILLLIRGDRLRRSSALMRSIVERRHYACRAAAIPVHSRARRREKSGPRQRTGAGRQGTGWPPRGRVGLSAGGHRGHDVDRWREALCRGGARRDRTLCPAQAAGVSGVARYAHRAAQSHAADGPAGSCHRRFAPGRPPACAAASRSRPVQGNKRYPGSCGG
jgi:CHASE2 domain-containing sensor protein